MFEPSRLWFSIPDTLLLHLSAVREACREQHNPLREVPGRPSPFCPPFPRA